MDLGKFFRLFIFVLFLILFLCVAFSNVNSVTVSFYKYSYTCSLFVVIFVSFILGGVLTYLYSLIGILKDKYKIMSLNKKVSALEEQLKESASKEVKIVSNEVKEIDTKEESLGIEKLDLSNEKNLEDNND